LRARDSVRTLKRAKAAQSQFESRRRFLAPITFGQPDGPCERIGRFCLYHTGVPLSRIPDEAAGTARARRQLLATLASAAVSFPGDAWIAGQRVRYLIEARDDSSALRVAVECRAQRWWCLSLRGLALHNSGKTVAAEAAFDSALANMPLSTRCKWTDLSKLLDDASLDMYKKMSCGRREEASRRIWWLADPLYSRAGNDRRAEHFARRTWAEIEKQGANGFAVSWSGDLEEMVVRFGRSEKWTQDAPTPLAYSSPRISGEEPEPNYHFLPKVGFDTPLSAIGDSSWDLTERRPREAYAPTYAREFIALAPQIARFRRGDSALIVAAYDVTGDTAWKDSPIRAAIAIAPNDSVTPSVVSTDSGRKTGSLMIGAGSSPALIAVELLSLDSAVAARWRSAADPIPNDSSRLVLSDLLLFDATDSLASRLDGALATALGRLVVRRERKTGVYWEMYGTVAGDSTLPISLTLTPISAGLLRRAIRALGIGQRPAPINVRWSEPSPAGMFSARAVLLDLSLIPAGKYELKLQAGPSSTLPSARTIELR